MSKPTSDGTIILQTGIPFPTRMPIEAESFKYRLQQWLPPTFKGGFLPPPEYAVTNTTTLLDDTTSCTHHKSIKIPNKELQLTATTDSRSSAMFLALPIGWMYCTVTAGIISAFLISALIFPPKSIPYVKVAMIGNSMMYYNDFPRFMGRFSWIKIY
jgi:hypothetical protein